MPRNPWVGAAVAAGLVALAPTAEVGAQTRAVAVFGGSAEFQVPKAWHVLREGGEGALVTHIYHIRSVRTDSASPDRANVLLNFYRPPGTPEFKALTDTMLGGLIDRSMLVLEDTIMGGAQRAVFWRGQQGATPYVGYDDFARSGDIWVHVRIVFPLIPGREADWNERLSSETLELLRSIRLAGKKAFPVAIGYPHLTTLTAE